MAASLADDDQLPARLLFAGWMPTTGRSLRADVTPQLCTEEELLTSWADKQTSVGCVVATGLTSRRDAR